MVVVPDDSTLDRMSLLLTQHTKFISHTLIVGM